MNLKLPSIFQNLTLKSELENTKYPAGTPPTVKIEPEATEYLARSTPTVKSEPSTSLTTPNNSHGEK